ncbi:MAG: PTS sugar transporter subunit IIA [Candidatus Omnitrophica bacterium]|nr:PTS sugar transporter subunit IIA [Candidatus Omnitrophota bacterium]
MRIMDFLDAEAVEPNLKATDKKGVIEEMVGLLVRAGSVKEADKTEITRVLLERESLGSTGIGQSVGIPHGKSDRVDTLVAAFGKSNLGVDFDSLDGAPVHLFFLLVAPHDSAGPHLKALARISRLLKDRFFREELKKSMEQKALVEIIRAEDEKVQ